jgi:arsenite/tail-anchored protein-transporting ATPase
VARVLLLTGKGGVGKTTSAAATALRCAAAGHRTLVLSTDPAHSLADAFDMKLGAQPTEIADRVSGQQLDAQARLEASWSELRAYLSTLFQWVGVQAIEAEELSVLPGLDEVFALGDLRDHLESGLWDVIVVDCAPTAETLRLLTLPEVLSWWMDRLFPLSRQVSRLVGPALSLSTSLPVPDVSVFDALQRFYDRIDAVRKVLNDPTQTTVRLVVNPERMVIAEARRTYTYLSLFGYQVDAVIANRMLPDEITDPWFDAWKESHASHLADIEAAFAPLPVLRVPLAPSELAGIEALDGFGRELYGDRDPAIAMHEGTPLQVSQRDGAWVLTIELPFAEKDEVALSRKGDELLVRIGGHRRAILLPDSLRRRRVVDAVVDRGRLEVVFGEAGWRGRAG